MANDSGVTEEELRKALEICILLVENYGNDYMPALNRIADELEKIKSNEKALARAKWLLADPDYLDECGAS